MSKAASSPAYAWANGALAAAMNSPPMELCPPVSCCFQTDVGHPKGRDRPEMGDKVAEPGSKGSKTLASELNRRLVQSLARAKAWQCGRTPADSRFANGLEQADCVAVLKGIVRRNSRSAGFTTYDTWRAQSLYASGRKSVTVRSSETAHPPLKAASTTSLGPSDNTTEYDAMLKLLAPQCARGTGRQVLARSQAGRRAPSPLAPLPSLWDRAHRGYTRTQRKGRAQTGAFRLLIASGIALDLTVDPDLRQGRYQQGSPPGYQSSTRTPRFVVCWKVCAFRGYHPATKPVRQRRR